ncbi:MAG TPA: NADH-quinone oxidoreductase subunit NuoH [Sulfurimonas sp.]|nr:NADH-quinone oxidoreductase subunit NuoH [Sulfurimonas sp.]
METAYFIETIIKIVTILLVFSALAGIGTYFERKILAFMQRRLGPMVVGPYGIAQVAADGIKLFTKEDIIPTNVVAKIFKIAPVITAATAFMAAAAIPFMPSFTVPFTDYVVNPIVADINVGVLYVLAVMAVGLYGPLLGGMASANKYSLLSAARGAAVFISYEVITGLSLIAPLMMIGSFSLIDMNNFQNDGYWMVVYQPVAMILFVIAGFAETGRTPFHLVANDHEIIDGFGTEYSGMRWGLFFIGEYANMFFYAFLISIIFFGGFGDGTGLGALALLGKVAFWFFFFLWTRAAWPDIRPDQLMSLCWKILMPLAVINVVITGFVLMF